MGYDNDGRWDMHDGSGWAGWFMMGLLLVVGLAVLVGLVLVLLRGQNSGVASGGSGSREVAEPGSAVKTLDDRLARGEIDVAEYRERKSALLGSA